MILYKSRRYFVENRNENTKRSRAAYAWTMKFITRKYVGDMPDRTGDRVRHGIWGEGGVEGGRPRLSKKSGFDVAISLGTGVNPQRPRQRPRQRLPLLFGLTLMYIFFC